MMQTVENKAAPWALEAAQLPIAFSQVREDPRVDEAVLRELAPGARVFMIASGGDTAAALIASGLVKSVFLVDINRAQRTLSRLKIWLLQHSPVEERLAVLGYREMAAAERKRIINGVLKEVGETVEDLGPEEFVTKVGPDFAGRYEVLFEKLRERLSNHRAELERLFELGDPVEQARMVGSETALGKAMDAAFAETMQLENLVCLFGEGATRNARIPFCQHFAERTRHALSTMPANTNPFLAQLLLGKFTPNAPYDWLTREAPETWPDVSYFHTWATDLLDFADEEMFDFIHLSNILDWLSPKQAQRTLGLAWRALRPGGRVIIRQLNSTLEIPAAEPRFAWLDQTAALHAADRSFFYRELFIGEKR
ncbi:MAG: DUF3419 family protein [Chthoniobacteraceae bacterium]